MDLTFQVPMPYCSLQLAIYFHHQSYSQLGIVFALAPSLPSFGVISPLISSSILGTYQPGELIFQHPIIAFSYCSWGSQGKNTEVVCPSLLQWTTFCQTSPPWPAWLGWPHRAWLSFAELDKAVVRVIRLASCLWLWFLSVCPLMPFVSAYRLTWVSLILDLGYLFTTAPAKRSCCSLPWTWGSSSWPHFCSIAATMLQDSVVLAQKQKYRPMEQDRKPRNKPMHLWVPYFWQRSQEHTMGQRQPLQ